MELKSVAPEDYCGIIEECAGGVITLKQIGIYGEDDGTACIRCDEIGRINCDNQDMNSRIFFAQSH